jgi:hypothetical protein
MQASPFFDLWAYVHRRDFTALYEADLATTSAGWRGSISSGDCRTGR